MLLHSCELDYRGLALVACRDNERKDVICLHG